MLILEGSDCLGKSTFANLLLKVADEFERFPTFYSHMGRPNASFDFLHDYKDMMSKYAVQDRFHLGGIVWHDALTDAALSLIEGWLQSIGSLTVVMYASDDVWYNQRLLDDDRGNLLTQEAMMIANDVYTQMATGIARLNPNVYLSWDVKSVMNDSPVYPDESFARKLIQKWFERLELL